MLSTVSLRALALLAVAPFLATPLVAQDFTIVDLTTEGDDVPGVGQVTRLDNLEANNAGTVWGEWDTDNADTNADQVLLVDGVLTLREGDPVPSPPNAFINSFDSIQANDAGEVSYNLFLEGAGVAAGTDSGVYVDFGSGLVLVTQEGDPAPGFTAGTTWQGFFETRINDSRQVLVIGTIDDPAIGTGSIDDAMVRYDLDAAGNIVNTLTVYFEGIPYIGGSDPIELLETGAHESAFNDAGQVLFAGHTTGPTDFDDFIALDGVPIALEGGASPVAGRNWASLASPELDLNNVGGHVYSGSLDGDSTSNLLIVRNGAKFRQEGDPVPVASLSAFNLTSFGSGPLIINDLDEVLWYGDWDDADTDVDTGLFLDDKLMVQEGVTIVGGLVVDTVRGVQDGYAMSDDGETIVAELVLTGNIDVLVQIERNGTTTILEACNPNDAMLSVVNGAPTIGQNLDVQMEQSPYPSALASLFVSPGVWPIGPCGLDLPGVGEVSIDILSPLLFSLPMPSFAGFPVIGSFPVNNSPGLVGATVYMQGVFIDATLTDPEPFRLTNGLGVTFGD